MIVKTRFTLPEDRMPDEDAIPSPFGLPLFRGCPDEIEIWEFGSTPITEHSIFDSTFLRGVRSRVLSFRAAEGPQPVFA